jgi:hypothetical protein
MSLTNTDTPVFVPEDIAGRILGGEKKPLSVRTLQRMREDGRGPPYHKFGQAVRYELSDLLSWAASRRREAVSAPSVDTEASVAPSPIATAPAEQPRKKRGWPKGKPRGPRKAPTPTSAAAE